MNLRWSGLLIAWAIPVLAMAGEAGDGPREVIPWGDMAFLDDHTLLAPYALVERATEGERKKAHEELERWRRAPVGEIVDELSRARGAKDMGSLLARALTKIFVESVRENPARARRQIEAMRWVREMGLRVYDIEFGRLRRKGRIPVWRGRARVDDRLEVVPGQSERRVKLANLRVGVRAGSRHIVAWVRYLPGAASVFLDRQTLEIEHVAKGFAPLAWIGDGKLLGWRRNDRGVPMIGIYRLAESGGLHALALADMASPAGLMQIRPLYAGAPPLAATLAPEPLAGPHERDALRHAGSGRFMPAPRALLCAGARIWLMDLRSGDRKAVGRDRVWMGCPLSAGPFLWGAADMAGGPRLVRLEPEGDGLIVSGEWPFPREGFWFAPVAHAGGGLWLLRDAGVRGEAHGGGRSATTSRKGEIWRFDVDREQWTRVTTPPIGLESGKLSEGARFIAVSPDGRWLAIREDETHIRLRSVSALLE
jgi:hypothetical protein